MFQSLTIFRYYQKFTYLNKFRKMKNNYKQLIHYILLLSKSLIIYLVFWLVLMQKKTSNVIVLSRKHLKKFYIHQILVKNIIIKRYFSFGRLKGYRPIQHTLSILKIIKTTYRSALIFYLLLRYFITLKEE